MSESTDEVQQIILQMHREGQKVDCKMYMKKTGDIKQLHTRQ